MGSARRPRRLSAAFVQTINEPGRYGDGHGGFGLSLRVKPRSNGQLSKTWAQRLRIDGKSVDLGLGMYPIVTLAEAREAALSNRRKVAQGRDPREKPIAKPTFEQAADKAIALRRPRWKSGPQEERIWRASLRDYAMPTLGPMRVDRISSADILAVLTPIVAEKPETARRLRQRIAAVMNWCVAQGHRSDNPAGPAISPALPLARMGRRHYPALPYDHVGEAVRKVRASGAYQATVLCFEFLVLCATRSGEARNATWDEIDLAAATWTIRSERMKSGRPHRVPLPKRAIEVLNEAWKISDGSGLVFPSSRGRVLSNMTMSKLLKELGIPAVPHGFRSSFRDWAAEQTDAPRAVMEAALAHKLGDAAEQAYARSDLFEKRRKLMEAWGRYISGISTV